MVVLTDGSFYDEWLVERMTLAAENYETHQTVDARRIAVDIRQGDNV